jgi:hypothetical protein
MRNPPAGGHFLGDALQWGNPMRVFRLSPLSIIVRSANFSLDRGVAYDPADRRAILKASPSGLPALDKKPAKIELSRWNARRRLVTASRDGGAVGKMASRHRVVRYNCVTGELILPRTCYSTLHANLSCSEVVFFALAQTRVIAPKNAFGS